MNPMGRLGWLLSATTLVTAAPACSSTTQGGPGSGGEAGSGGLGGAAGSGGLGGAGGSGGEAGGGGSAAPCENAPAGTACGTDAACDGLGHCLVTLASSLKQPSAIAVDAESVYFTDGADDGGVMKCAVNGCGGAPTLLASGQVAPWYIALDATHVYWGNHGINGVDGSVRRCAVGGCGGAPESLAESVFLGDLAVDAAHLYFTEITPMGASGAGLLFMCPPGGCAGNPQQIAAVDGVPSGLAANGTSVAWGAAPTGSMQMIGAVMQCSPAGCMPATLASGPSINPRAMAMDAANVYFINADFTVMKAALVGADPSMPTTLASFDGNDIPDAIVTDGVNVYWTVLAMGGTPAIMKCDVNGCDNKPTTLAGGPMVIAPYGIAVDATSVYWTDAGAGTVMKTAK